MKKNFYLMTALCAIIFSACSSSTDPIPSTEESDIAKVVLSVNPATRATGTTEPNDDNTAEKKISRLTVAVFNNANGAVLTIQEKEEENPTTLSFDCPLSVETVCSAIVVANAPSGHFAGVTTRDGFLAQTFSLGDAQTSANLPMSGAVLKDASASTFTLTPGGASSANTLSVALSRLVSRVIVKKIATDFSSTGAYSASVFKLTNVFVRNALSTVKPATGGYADTKPDGALGATNYLTGGGTEDSGFTQLASLNSAAASGWNPLVTLTHNYIDNTKYYFYVFPNEDSAYPTTLVLQGTFDTDGDNDLNDETNTGKVFYPVVINKSQIGSVIKDGGGVVVPNQTGTIARSTKYQLDITIRSKGVASPADKIDPASLAVTVTVTGWIPYGQFVDFN